MTRKKCIRRSVPAELPSQLRNWLDENNIEEIEAVVPDMAGVAKGKILPAKKYQDDVGLRLPETIFAQTVDGNYPSQWDVLGDTDSDIFLKPDPGTVRQVPFAEDPSAVIIHDCFYLDGAPVDIAPRQVLRRVLDLYEARGWNPVVAPEVEFYLVKPNTDPDYPLEPPVGRSGRAESGRQAFSVDAVNEFDPLFEDLYDYCEIQEIGIETLIHESGAAQMEINLLHGNPMDLADQVFLFKRGLREVAMRHKIYATFMAAPMEGEPGSAMHVHQSVVDAGSGRNIFSNTRGNESRLFRWHIGGMQKYLPDAMALIAPNVNSYRRLAPDKWGTPINTAWGYDNRTAGLRVPVSTPQARRVENRIAGADVNPYLALAASLACGYLGMVEQIKPSPPVSTNAYGAESQLPHTLREAVDGLLECEPLREILGERFVRLYASIKHHEYDTFLNVISAWEREHLLLNV
ncbi:MAG: glutamine synthetase family protein [Gammaproteobacteria bacterium]|nr:glutamine synthetase family protein [Gammaproteobacteria bacterium]MXX17014.1 glutamine synthetase [Gammaproteobacteria bacterium]